MTTDGSSIPQQKKKLRKRIQEALTLLSADEVAKQSSTITSKVLRSAEYNSARSLSVFLSMPGKEVSTHEIVKQALKDDKRVYVPYIHPSKQDSRLKIMDMLRLQDEVDLDSLQPDAWGIPSLSKDSVRSRENALGGIGCLEDVEEDLRGSANLDLIFMPSMAFDRSLNRLGHGKGFYDRYLTLCQTLLSQKGPDREMPRLVGLALKVQVLPEGQELPVDDRDWKVDSVITSEE